jgi:hypothetical protein
MTNLSHHRMTGNCVNLKLANHPEHALWITAEGTRDQLTIVLAFGRDHGI